MAELLPWDSQVKTFSAQNCRRRFSVEAEEETTWSVELAMVLEKAEC